MADPKLSDVDPIFGGKKEEPQYKLDEIDPIFRKDFDVKKPEPASEFDFQQFLIKQLGLEDNPNADKIIQRLAGGAGAVAGATMIPNVTRDIQNAKTTKALADLPAAIRELSKFQESPFVPTDPQHTRQMQGTTEQGATGRARMQTFNEQTSQQAAARKEAESVMNRLKQMGVLTGENQMAKAAGVTSTPSGVLLPAGAVYEPAPPPPAPKPSPLQAAATNLKGVAGALARSPVLSGALGGYGAASGAVDAYQRQQAGDDVGAKIAALGAAGSAVGMIPTVPTAVIGQGTALTAQGALAMMQRMKEMRAREQNYNAVPTEREMEDAQRAAFAMRRKPV